MAITPGPWAFDGRRWIRDAAGRGVLRVQLGADPDNVRAAAAGPGLLEALQELLGPYAGGAASALDDPYIRERALQAIAAAEPQG